MNVRRVVALVLAAGMLVAGFGGPADAKKKKKAKPVTTTLYMHGDSTLGEQDSPAIGEDFLPMDATKPSGTDTKSKTVMGFVPGISPNPNCAGNNFFAVWTGTVAGTIKGDMTFKFSTIGPPTSFEIRVWADVTGLLCNEQYPQPGGTVVVDIPAGTGDIEATIKGVNFRAAAFLMVQVMPAGLPSVTRIQYDSTDAATSLTFKCTPNPGKKACA